jgi:hypothetical protein
VTTFHEVENGPEGTTWFFQDPGEAFRPIGDSIQPRYSDYIRDTLKNHRIATPMDLVQPRPDGVIAANLPTMTQLYDEYTAKMVMARNTADCEAMYQEFLRMLETRARWSQMKAEWERLYAAMR